MSLDLTILPLRDQKDLLNPSVLCYDRLMFVSDYAIFSQLIDMSEYRSDDRQDILAEPTIPVTPIPSKLLVQIYTDTGIRRIRSDNLGAKLTYVPASSFKNLRLRRDAHRKNRAIKAFVKSLPGDTPIILLWT